MAEVNIVIADDEELIHADLRRTLDSINFQYKIVKDFYDTSSLKHFLRSMNSAEDCEGIDVLILDHSFGGGGQNGLDALPTIRRISRNLPVLMLTTFEDDLFDEARKLYNIDYIQKPVKSSDLRFRIKSIIEKMQDWENFQQELVENKELENYLIQENELLSQTVDQIRTENVEHSLPMNMQTLIQNIFPDIEFLPKAFRLLIKSTIKKADWNRIFRNLKLIDWKNETDAGSGVKIQKYKEGVKSGYSNMWEYRFSQAGRVFVERRDQDKPLIVLIDPVHAYSDMGRL